MIKNNILWNRAIDNDGCKSVALTKLDKVLMTITCAMIFVSALTTAAWTITH